MDGVRALSLIAILLYHSGFLWAQGGYLGVTVFFTLSGFLIGGLLLTERESSGALKLRRFWGRRARRLAPAIIGLLLLVVILLLAGGLNKDQALFGDALATSTWVANWRFILAGEPYAALFGSPSPFQHMWSLAVEEQFYLVLPPVVLLCFARGGRGGRWKLAAVVSACIVVSTVVCSIAYDPTSTDRAYFGTDSRMAEPLVGVLLALLLIGRDGPRQFERWQRQVIGCAGLLAAVALAFLVFSLGEFNPRLYHGGFLLTAVLSAVVVTAATQTTVLSWLLSRDLLVGLGRVSYGAYVYHWPIFIWLSPDRTGLDPFHLFVVRTALTLAIAGFSYVVVEKPIRSGLVRPALAVPAWASSAAALLLLVALVAVPSAAQPRTAEASSQPATGVAAGDPTPSAAPGAPQRAAQPQPGGAAGANSASAGTGSGAGSGTGAPAPPPEHRIAFVGDSMSYGLAGGMAQWAQSHPGYRIFNAAIQGCPITRGGVERWPDGEERQVPANCGWWADSSSSAYTNLMAFNPDLIVIQDGAMEMPDRQEPGWPTFFAPGDGVYDTWMLGEWQKAINSLTRGTRTKVMLLTAVCADWQYAPWNSYTVSQTNQRNAALNSDYRSLSAVNYSLQDLNTIVCPNGTFTQTVDGVPNARSDGYHLSAAAAYAVSRDWLAPVCLQDLGLS